jgi:hypothetical protein
MEATYPPQAPTHRTVQNSDFPPAAPPPTAWQQKNALSQQLRSILSSASLYCDVTVLAGLVNTLGALEADLKTTPPDISFDENLARVSNNSAW